MLLEVAYDIFLAFVLFSLLLRGYHITISGRQVAPCLHTINKPFYPLQVKHKFYPYCHVRHAPSIDSNTRMLVKVFFGLLKGSFIILNIDIPLHYMLDLVIACICVHNMSNVNYDAIYIN